MFFLESSHICATGGFDCRIVISQMTDSLLVSEMTPVLDASHMSVTHVLVVI